MCDFCEAKKFLPIRYSHSKPSMRPMSDDFGSLFGIESISGVQLEETDNGAFLSYDNSAKEYASGLFKIAYCPLCGRKLAR